MPLRTPMLDHLWLIIGYAIQYDDPQLFAMCGKVIGRIYTNHGMQIPITVGKRVRTNGR